MREKNKGYWVYSIVAIILGMALLAFLAYLLYDLILKLSEKDFSSNTVLQAFITLFITVFAGGYISKWLELRNTKKIEQYKIRTSLALTLIDLSSALYYHPEDEDVRRAVVRESSKIKLYFPDEVLKLVNEFIESENKAVVYSDLIKSLRESIK